MMQLVVIKMSKTKSKTSMKSGENSIIVTKSNARWLAVDKTADTHKRNLVVNL